MEIMKISKVLYNNERVVVKNMITKEDIINQDEEELGEKLESEMIDYPEEKISVVSLLYSERFITAITFMRGDTWNKVISENKGFLGVPEESILSKVIFEEGRTRLQLVFNPNGKIPSPFPEGSANLHFVNP